MYTKSMLSDFIAKQLGKARYRLLDDGSYFGEVVGVQGVWANTKKLEDYRKELQEVLEDWLVLKLQSGEKVPGITIKRDRRSLVKHA